MTRRGQSQVTPRTVWTVGLNALGVFALWRMAEQVWPVLGVMGLALILALAVEPLVQWLRQRGLRRGAGVALVLTVVAGLLTLMAATLVPMLIAQLRSLLGALPELIQRLFETQWVQRLEEEFGVAGELRTELASHTAELAEPLVNVVQRAVGLAAALVVLFFLVLFMLLFGPELYVTALRWVPPGRRRRVQGLVDRLRVAVGGYMAGSVAVAGVGAAGLTLVLALLGVPYFLPLGLSYLVLGLIPWIGSALAATMVSLTTLAALGWQRALVVLGIFLVYQQLEGNILQPLVQRHTLRMNPLLISLVLLLGGAVGGLGGLVLSLPIAAALQVLLEDLRRQRHGKRQPPSGRGKEGSGEGLLFTGSAMPAGRDSGRGEASDEA